MKCSITCCRTGNKLFENGIRYLAPCKFRCQNHNSTAKTAGKNQAGQQRNNDDEYYLNTDLDDIAAQTKLWFDIKIKETLVAEC